jgi:hypothetical protein
MHFYKYHTFRIRDMKLGRDFVLGLDPFTGRVLDQGNTAKRTLYASTYSDSEPYRSRPRMPYFSLLLCDQY